MLDNSSLKTCRGTLCSRSICLNLFDTQCLPHGDIIVERLVSVLIDRPSKREKISVFLEKTLYEREYLRKVYVLQVPCALLSIRQPCLD